MAVKNLQATRRRKGEVPSRSCEESTLSMRLRTPVAISLIVLASLAAYHNSFTGPFIFDDMGSITDNPHIRSLWPIWEAMKAPDNKTADGRPVLCLSLAVNYLISEYRVWSYHALNLAIHILSAVTLFGIVRRTLQSERLRRAFGSDSYWLALACAVLWAVHPLQTESVTYIIQRTESLMGLFYLLTLYCAIRGMVSRHSRRWYAAAAACCAAGMGTKEVMVTAPVIVLLYDRVFVTRSLRDIFARRWGLYTGLALSWLILTALMGSNPRGASAGFDVQPVTPVAYAMTQCRVVLHYLRLSFWPDSLVLDYTWPVAESLQEVAGHAVILAALVAGAAFALRYVPAVGFAAAWFFVILAPTSSFVPILDPAFEHRMYLPLAGVVATTVCVLYLAAKAVAGPARARGALAVTLAASVTAAAALTPATISRNTDYRSAMAIWTDTIEKRPANARAIGNRAVALEELGRYDEAIADYSSAIELRPRYVAAYHGRGNAYLAKALTDEAIRDFSTAIELDPNLYQAYSNRGIALTRQGRPKAAIPDFTKAVEIAPDYEKAYCNRAMAYGQLGMDNLAIADCAKAIKLDPAYAKAYNNRGLVYSAKGMYAEAIGDFTEAIRLAPDFANAYGARGAAYLALGEPRRAMADLDQAIRLNPTDKLARKNREKAMKLPK